MSGMYVQSAMVTVDAQPATGGQPAQPASGGQPAQPASGGQPVSVEHAS